MLLDMGLYGNEISLDKLGGLLVLVGLGIQPNASSSSRRGTEVDQDRKILLLRFNKSLIDICSPIHRILHA